MNTKFEIKLLKTIKQERDKRPYKNIPLFVTPGVIITSDPSFMRGHGTDVDKEGKMHATVAGSVVRINKLCSVKPQKFKYNGEIGDVVVGRIVEVQHRKWIVDVNARLNGILLLTSVNLPGGNLRRKTEEDELMMKNYLEVGDLVSAEVQSVFNDGSLSLYTRTLKYGKLGQGQLVKVPPALIRRKKTHFHYISGVQIILSNNGYIWLAPQCAVEVETGGYVENKLRVTKVDRESIARIRNCIMALVRHNKMLCDTTILYAFEASSTHEAKEILKTEVIDNIVDCVNHRIQAEGL